MRALVQDVYAQLPPSGDVLREFERRGIPTERFADASSAQSKLGRGADVLVVMGDLPVMNTLLAQHGKADRLLPAYPPCLHELLHRRVWAGTLASLRAGPAGALSPVFVKPRQPQLFGGAVVSSLAVAAAHPGVTPQTELLCAEVVDWNLECRAYVHDGRLIGCHVYRILGVAHCVPLDGLDVSPPLRLDVSVVRDAVATMNRCEAGVAGYCLDFGVLGSGQTALVEANDALGLANCGLPIADYVDLHIARWQQLMPAADARPGRGSDGGARARRGFIAGR